MGKDRHSFGTDCNAGNGNEPRPFNYLGKGDRGVFGTHPSYAGKIGGDYLNKGNGVLGINSLTDHAELTLSSGLHDTLETRTTRGLTTLYIDGISVVSYSPIERKHFGRKIILEKEDLFGNLFFNTEFFRRFNFDSSSKTGSEMQNIAKTFFKVDRKNYVALVQYLREGGRSAEHYHTLEESIAQLAGRSYVEIRPVNEDTNYKIIELSQGDILRIPADNLHFVVAFDEGSLTIPIKQTLASRKDHLYAPKSDKRIKQELNVLIHKQGYPSGDAIISELHGYYEGLMSDSERSAAATILNKESDESSNPNVRTILKQLISRYP